MERECVNEAFVLTKDVKRFFGQLLTKMLFSPLLWPPPHQFCLDISIVNRQQIFILKLQVNDKLRQIYRCHERIGRKLPTSSNATVQILQGI